MGISCEILFENRYGSNFGQFLKNMMDSVPFLGHILDVLLFFSVLMHMIWSELLP